MKTILFWENELNLRGTSVSTYDYAFYNETILNNKSIIVSDKNSKDLSSLSKFNKQFEVHLLENFDDINKIPHDYFYTQKYGYKDDKISKIGKNLIHVVFPSYQPHGDVYAYISKWLSKQYNHPLFVPYMIDLPKSTHDYSKFLNLNRFDFVFGWYGGNNFEIEYAREAVIKSASERKGVCFLFMNQEPFCDLDNVIFLEGTSCLYTKSSFINSCDAMIHARSRGETFGLAIAEFSSKNKPVITCINSPEKNHIFQLGDKGIYYEDFKSLYNILMNVNRDFTKSREWNMYKEFSPENVMRQFNEVFLSL